MVLSPPFGSIWTLSTSLRFIESKRIPPGQNTLGSIMLSANSHLSCFLLSIQPLYDGASAQLPVSVRFLFAKESGYVARSDIFELRLECSPYFLEVASFLTPLVEI